MIERFRDLLLFAAIGACVTMIIAAWLGIAAATMTFAERWTPAASLPPAVALPQKHSLPEVPIYFCARYVSTTRCRIA